MELWVKELFEIPSSGVVVCCLEHSRTIPDTSFVLEGLQNQAMDTKPKHSTLYP